MSGSENSEFKGPPSLLSRGAADEKSQSNRILASLEGQVGATRKPAVAKRRRGVAALVLLLLCGASGAFWVMRDRLGGTGAVRQAEATHAPAATLASASALASTPATTLAAASASAAAASAAASDTAQAATIVNDSDAPASAATLAAQGPASSSSIPSSPAQASAPASPAPAMVAAAGPSATHEAHHATHEAAPHGKASDTSKLASHAAHRTVVAEHPKPVEHGKKELARTDKTDKADKIEKTSKTAQAHPRGDDPDVDLLTMLVARTKPAVRTSAGAPRHDQLTEQLKQCDKLGFFASERCRQDTCAGQAGKDLDCPAVQASSTH
jgi:hypothetical protein